MCFVVLLTFLLCVCFPFLQFVLDVWYCLLSLRFVSAYSCRVCLSCSCCRNYCVVLLLLFVVVAYVCLFVACCVFVFFLCCVLTCVLFVVV